MIEIIFPEDAEDPRQELADRLVLAARRRANVHRDALRARLLALAQGQQLSPDAVAVIIEALGDAQEQAESYADLIREDVEQRLGIEHPQLQAPEVIVIDPQKGDE